MKITEEKIQNRLLLKRAIEQNCSESFERIFQKNRDFVENYIAAKIRHGNEVDDLVQIVFMKILEGKCKYKGKSEVQGFLCGIANNVVHNHIRQKKRQLHACSLDEIEIMDNPTESSHQNKKSSNPIQNEEIKQILKEAITTLPVKSIKRLNWCITKASSLVLLPE